MKKALSRLTALVLAAAIALSSAFALDLAEAQALTEQYFSGTIPENAYEAETVTDFIAALGDPYSQYFTAQEYAAFLSSMEDRSTVGIGIIATYDEQGILVEQVLSGSSAEQGGLMAGDILFSADGVALTGLSLEDAIGHIQGTEGSWVRVGYLRQGQKHSLTLRRNPVVIAATDGQIMEGKVGYIQCTTFGTETYDHFCSLLDEMEPQVESYLIDLRGNSGGLTDAAAQTAGLFAGAGGIIQLRYPDGEYSIYQHTSPAVTQKPVVVLVDSSTASAAEAFAAILRDTGRGLLVGGRTYGKGVAQGVLDQNSFPQLFDGDALKLTIARFYSPLGNTTDLVGVIPDFLVQAEYALMAGWLLLAVPQEDSDALLDFSGPSGSYTLDLTRLETDDQKAALGMVLDSLPEGSSLQLNGQTISQKDLAEQFALPAPTPSFTDLAEAESPEILDLMKRKGLLAGDGAGAFHPQETLSRGQLCQLLYQLLNGKTTSSPATAFSDVSDDDWYAEAVSFAASQGYLTGVGEGLFFPEEPVDTQQLITVLGRLAAKLNCDLLDDGEWWDAQELTLYPDYPAWCQTPLWLLENSQDTAERDVSLLWEDRDTLQPKDVVSRETAAYAVYRVLAYLAYLR